MLSLSLIVLFPVDKCSKSMLPCLNFLKCSCQIQQEPICSSNQIKSNQIKSNQIKSNQIKSNQIKSNQIKSNRIESNRIESNRIESNRIKSNQIKSNLFSITQHNYNVLVFYLHSIISKRRGAPINKMLFQRGSR